MPDSAAERGRQADTWARGVIGHRHHDDPDSPSLDSRHHHELGDLRRQWAYEHPPTTQDGPGETPDGRVLAGSGADTRVRCQCCELWVLPRRLMPLGGDPGVKSELCAACWIACGDECALILL